MPARPPRTRRHPASLADADLGVAGAVFLGAAIHLVGTVLAEQNDEWTGARVAELPRPGASGWQSDGSSRTMVLESLACRSSGSAAGDRMIHDADAMYMAQEAGRHSSGGASHLQSPR